MPRPAHFHRWAINCDTRGKIWLVTGECTPIGTSGPDFGMNGGPGRQAPARDRIARACGGVAGSSSSPCRRGGPVHTLMAKKTALRWGGAGRLSCSLRLKRMNESTNRAANKDYQSKKANLPGTGGANFGMNGGPGGPAQAGPNCLSLWRCRRLIVKRVPSRRTNSR